MCVCVCVCVCCGSVPLQILKAFPISCFFFACFSFLVCHCWVFTCLSAPCSSSSFKSSCSSFMTFLDPPSSFFFLFFTSLILHLLLNSSSPSPSSAFIPPFFEISIITYTSTLQPTLSDAHSHGECGGQPRPVPDQQQCLPLQHCHEPHHARQAIAAGKHSCLCRRNNSQRFGSLPFIASLLVTRRSPPAQPPQPQPQPPCSPDRRVQLLRAALLQRH